MKNKTTEIIFVLDESGSMGSVRNDTIGGVNTFIEDQKALPGKALFTMATFNTQNTIKKQSVLLEGIEPLNNENYRPGGGTALLDAVGQTINDVVSRHATLNEEDKPGKVILVVLTDGEENSSREFTQKSDIGKMIGEREDAGWEVLFLGADIDAWGDGRSMGFSKMKSMDKNDMLLNMKKASHYTASYRGVDVGATLSMNDVNTSFDMSEEQIDQEMENLKNTK